MIFLAGFKLKEKISDFILNPSTYSSELMDNWDQTDPIRDASDLPSLNVSHAETSQTINRDSSGILLWHFGTMLRLTAWVQAVPFTGDSVCGLIAQKSTWRRRWGCSWIHTILQFSAAIFELYNHPLLLSSQHFGIFYHRSPPFPTGMPRSPVLFICFILFVFSNLPPLLSQTSPTSMPALFLSLRLPLPQHFPPTWHTFHSCPLSLFSIKLPWLTFLNGPQDLITSASRFVLYTCSQLVIVLPRRLYRVSKKCLRLCKI